MAGAVIAHKRKGELERGLWRGSSISYKMQGFGGTLKGHLGKDQLISENKYPINLRVSENLSSREFPAASEGSVRA